MSFVRSLFKLLIPVTLVLLLKVEARRKRPVLRDGLYKNFRFNVNRRLTDEFKSRRLNRQKWKNLNARWAGRQPGLFRAENVKQRRGKLLLFGRYETRKRIFQNAPKGYEKYTTSYVETTKNVRYGYFEVRAKPGNSRLSSAFWGSLDTSTLWTEIDVFEIGGGAINDAGTDFRKRVNMNLHVFRDKKRNIVRGKNEFSRPSYYVHSRYLRSSFNTYGLDWNRRWITWTFNGRRIRSERNTHWKQAFPIKLDVETMPHWFGLPSRRTLPAVFKVDYFRAWSRKRKRRPRRSSRMLNISDHQFSQFSNLLGGTTPASASMEDEEVMTEEESEDDADIEIDESIPEQSPVPMGGLQRPPIPGSNEQVYMPVIPLGGGSWDGAINQVNSLMNDVIGIEIEAGEDVNVADFSGEIMLYKSFGNPLAPAPMTDSETDAETDSGPVSDEAPVSEPDSTDQNSTPGTAPIMNPLGNGPSLLGSMPAAAPNPAPAPTVTENDKPASTTPANVNFPLQNLGIFGNLG